MSAVNGYSINAGQINGRDRRYTATAVTQAGDTATGTIPISVVGSLYQDSATASGTAYSPVVPHSTATVVSAHAGSSPVVPHSTATVVSIHAGSVTLVRKADAVVAPLVRHAA